MNRLSGPIALAERRVAEARTSVLDEYHSARARMRRRAGSPMFMGGILLGAIALGYFATGRGKAKRPIYRERPGAWSMAAKTVQVLLPLLLALSSRARPARRRGADAGVTEV